ncbi:MAG TPA: DUF2520 domain-containing protein [Gammaproteobacteria bacterium]|nr:DUF2520 domain-containing protein [Gammaproteobacteria bacterium]
MRQVPHPLIIGDGKMATHFGHYLSLLGINYSQWSRKKYSDIALEKLFSHSTITLLLISDNSLINFLDSHAYLKTKPVVHFSGALSLKNIFSAHPLMSFAENLYTLEFYKKINFILETHQENHLSFLPNDFYAIPAEQKSYYHMLCALSGNFTCILWQKFFSELETKFQLPPTVGHLYLNQITQNIIRDPNTALTGPLIRHDKNTIHKHLDSLSDDEFKEIYQAFVNLFENRRKKIHEHA